MIDEVAKHTNNNDPDKSIKDAFVTEAKAISKDISASPTTLEQTLADGAFLNRCGAFIRKYQAAVRMGDVWWKVSDKVKKFNIYDQELATCLSRVVTYINTHGVENIDYASQYP